MSIEEDELLTVNEVADRLKLNQQTIRNWIDRGDLPAIRVGGRRVRVRRQDLDEYIALSSAARKPDTIDARKAVSEALTEAEAARDTPDEADAWRKVARAANSLARAVN